MNTPIRILALAIAVAGLAACQKKKVEPPQTAEPQAYEQPAAQTPPSTELSWTDVTTLDKLPCLVSRVAYFDYDTSAVKSEAMEMLRCHGKWLSNNPGARLTLEGHADERGSQEYNLGLGERRGNSVRDILLANGGRSEQLTVVSYGEERPIATESNESAWAQNRRVQLDYTARQ